MELPDHTICERKSQAGRRGRNEGRKGRFPVNERRKNEQEKPAERDIVLFLNKKRDKLAL